MTADKTILFAGANGILQEYLAMVLVSCGYHLLMAADGTDALQQARDYDGQIHLLLSDYDTSQMTTTELADGLNKTRPETKLLIIARLYSATPQPAHGWHILQRPFTADMLREAVRDATDVQSVWPASRQ